MPFFASIKVWAMLVPILALENDVHLVCHTVHFQQPSGIWKLYTYTYNSLSLCMCVCEPCVCGLLLRT